MSFKLAFITALALLGMQSIYIGQLVQAAAAPLTLCMCTYTRGVAYTVVSFKLAFITASALLGMHSIYIGQLVEITALLVVM